MQVENASFAFDPTHTLIKSTCDKLFDFSHLTVRNFIVESIEADAAFLFVRLRRLTIRPPKFRNIDMIKDMIVSFGPGVEHVDYDLAGLFDLPNLDEFRLLPIRAVQFRFLKPDFTLIEQCAGLRSLTDLRSITHNGFFVHTLSPQVFEIFPRLEALNLNFNKICDIEPGVFAKAHNLLELKISENKFKRLRAETLIGLQNLKRLRVDSIEIEKAGAFAHLASLTHLNLGKSGPLTKLEAGFFLGLAKLTELSLSDCGLQAIEAAALESLLCIEKLDLSSNKLSELEVKCAPRIVNLSHNELARVLFFNGSNLEEIDLSNNKLGRDRAIDFGECVSLNDGSLRVRKVDLSFNEIGHVRSMGGRRMGELRELVLSDNSIGEIEARAFEGLGALEELRLAIGSLNLCVANNGGKFKDLSNLRVLEIKSSLEEFEGEYFI
jgi:Leucine-rich repeat (LRR) protein